MKEKEVVESTTEVVAETTEETGLAIPKMSNIAMNLFGETKTKRITSLNLENEEEADMLLAASQEADHKLNDEVNKEIVVIGCSLSETPVETMNEDTGEVVVRKKHTLCLFDEKGESHVTGSNACYMSFMQIVALKGMPSKEKPYTLVPIKVPVKDQPGHTYLRLKYKKNNK